MKKKKGNISLKIFGVLLLATVAAIALFSINYKQMGLAPSITVRPKDTKNWKTIETKYFSLSTPDSWTFEELQGIDSYVGDFKGDGIELNFDYGWYSNSLDDVDTQSTVFYENIGGYKAKIVMPRKGKTGVMGIYFEKLDEAGLKEDFIDIKTDTNKLTLYTDGASDTNKDLLLKLFRSIIFDVK